MNFTTLAALAFTVSIWAAQWVHGSTHTTKYRSSSSNSGGKRNSSSSKSAARSEVKEDVTRRGLVMVVCCGKERRSRVKSKTKVLHSYTHTKSVDPFLEAAHASTCMPTCRCRPPASQPAEHDMVADTKWKLCYWRTACTLAGIPAQRQHLFAFYGSRSRTSTTVRHRRHRCHHCCRMETLVRHNSQPASQYDSRLKLERLTSNCTRLQLSPLIFGPKPILHLGFLLVFLLFSNNNNNLFSFSATSLSRQTTSPICEFITV